MAENYHEGKTFEKEDFTKRTLAGIEFQDCLFRNCNFGQANLGRAHFSDCLFDTCNLGMATLAGVKLENARFRHCKMLGINFSPCLDFLFSVSFEHCQLDFVSFVGKKLKQTKFDHCSIKEANFADSDLTEAVFDYCDLSQTLFNRSILNKADFRTASHYLIDLELNQAKKARFSADGLQGLLAKYDLVIS
ncbi:MAG: pentapeptide repeat-containing protein [Adhaeribacter sp.]